MVNSARSEILSRLQKVIQPLHSAGGTHSKSRIISGLECFNRSFPDHAFPLGTIHEFIPANTEDRGSTIGLMTAIASRIVSKKSYLLWVGSSSEVYPPGLKCLGMEPSRIIFINHQKEKDILWTTEEALKCKALDLVITEIPGLDFTSGRRLQLAAETGNVTGFVFRQSFLSPGTTASTSRWKINSVPGNPGNLPGVGFPRWQVEISKMRNGKTGNWLIEWRNGQLKEVREETMRQVEWKRKTG